MHGLANFKFAGYVGDKQTRWNPEPQARQHVYIYPSIGLCRSMSHLFFFFLRRYHFREVLAFSMSFFHLVRFLIQSFQSVIFILVISLITSSFHLFLGLPSDLVSAGDHSYTFFTMLLSGIRCTCPNQTNLCALMYFMMFLLPVSLFTSSFDNNHCRTIKLTPSTLKTRCSYWLRLGPRLWQVRSPGLM